MERAVGVEFLVPTMAKTSGLAGAPAGSLEIRKEFVKLAKREKDDIHRL